MSELHDVENCCLKLVYEFILYIKFVGKQVYKVNINNVYHFVPHEIGLECVMYEKYS